MLYSSFDEKSKYMNKQFVSHIKFTVKLGCVEDFLKAQSRADTDPLFSYLKTFTIQTEENAFVVTNIYDEIDQVMSTQDKALAWLDEIEPLHVTNENGSRTEDWLCTITQGRCEIVPC